MSRIPAACASIAAFAMLAGPATGQEKQGRYTMSPTEGGFVRLDTETGEMALCKRGADGAWACEAMPESEQAMRKDLERLRKENEELKSRGATAPNDHAGGPPVDDSDLVPPGGERRMPVPTEQDVDKLFDYVEGMVKKLKERLKRLEEQSPEKGTPL